MKNYISLTYKEYKKLLDDGILIAPVLDDESHVNECHMIYDCDDFAYFIPEKYFKKKETVITADIEYISGTLRTAHYELNVSEEEYNKFIEMPREEQEEFIRDNGELIIDDYRVNDSGDIINIEY